MFLSTPQILLLTGLLVGNPISWRISTEKVVAEARLRNVPVLILMTQDEDPETDAILRAYQNNKIAKFSSRAIFVIGHKGIDHRSEARKIKGKKEKICSLFNLPCSEHNKNYQALANRYFTKEFWDPVNIFLLPNGEEFFRFHKSQSPNFIAEEIERLLKASGIGIPHLEYRRILSEIEKAAQEAKEGNLKAGRQRIQRLERIRGRS